MWNREKNGVGVEHKMPKKNYIQMDYAKFFAAILVVAIHIPPLQDVNETASLVLQQVICRLAVPFFFLCSGFFLGKKLERKADTMRYAKRIATMYLLWSALYLPAILERFWKQNKTLGENLGELLRRFFLIGSYIQLWYLLGTLYGVLVLYLLLQVKGMTKNRLAVLALVVYLFGVAGNSYRHLWDGMPGIVAVLGGYRDWFATTRNGFFFAFPFLTMGYLLSGKQDKVKNTVKWTGALLLSLLALFVEFFALERWGSIASFDMYLMTPVAVGCLFCLLLTVQVSEKRQAAGQMLRGISTYIFLLHMMVNFYFKKIPFLKKGWMSHSFSHFLLVLLASILIAMVLQKRKLKKILKN